MYTSREVSGWPTQRRSDVIYRADCLFSLPSSAPWYWPQTCLFLVSGWLQKQFTQLVRDGEEMTLSLVPLWDWKTCLKLPEDFFPPSHHPKSIPKSVIGKRRNWHIGLVWQRHYGQGRGLVSLQIQGCPYLNRIKMLLISRKEDKLAGLESIL